ncbi:MAG TPA: RNA 2',3'-cyclic phosphodiesterase [Vicinamibacterales bacterium]|nr:RNA 2',3'-cyclic phosphodiesterase [Vicinamibacterales bacterium]
MRLFIAVEIDDPARRVAEATAEALRRAIGPAPNIRWVPAENMHLTVRFIGNVVDNRAAVLLDALIPPLEIAPFDIDLGGCGVFPPSRGAPRVIWMGLTAGLPNLAAMHDEFDRRLAPFGFEPERRAFSAHLTLARIKDAPGGVRAAVQPAIRDVTAVSTRCHITRATVFQSHLSPRGPRYEAIAIAMLTRC